MATNLTGSTIASTYDQLLHLDGGPEATEKTIYSGVGVATSLKLGTTSSSVGNVRVSGNTISTLDTNGNLVLAPNGTGSVAMSKVAVTGGTITGITDLAIADGGTGASTASDARTNLGLGTIATQNSNNVTITGGSITNVTFTGSFSGITSIDSTTFTTSNTAAGVTLTGNTLSADGTDTNIDINITPKGTGEVNVTNIDVLSGKVPFNTITNRAYAAFSDVTDQTGSTTLATAVKFGTTEVTGAGVTMVTDGTNLTRLTFAAAGIYAIALDLQLTNTDTVDHTVTIWLALNGTNIARSATKMSVPKAADGGSAFFQFVFYVTVAAGQYVQAYWLPSNTAVTLDHTAAAAGPPAVPAIPSAAISAERIA
jgi:hypothetical protein